MKQGIEQSHTLPKGFWSLLGLILINTMKMFFKKFPSTIFFIFIALVLHTFLLVVVNEGFNPQSSFVGQFLSLSSAPLSGVVIWTIVPIFLFSFFNRSEGKSSSPGFGVLLSNISTYFREERKDATAMMLGGFGVALTVGTLMSGYASFIMAAGVGALFASKSGSVIALLFRSAWTSIFNVARRDNIARYGLAAGYVTMFASSLGFILSSVLINQGAVIGIILLIVALVMAKKPKTSPTMTSILILGIIISSSSFFGFDMLWADDGGWNEAGSNFNGWWKSQGSTVAILMGVGPALGAAFGPLIFRVLNDMAENLPLDIDIPVEETVFDENSNPSTIDTLGDNDNIEWRNPITNEIPHPYDDTVHHGTGGKEGQFWYEGEWLDKAEITRLLVNVREKLDQQWEDIRVDQQKWADKQNEVRISKLKDDHFIFDEKNREWIKDPDYEPSKLRENEYATRLEYIKDIREKLSSDQAEIVDRILRNKLSAPYSEGFIPDKISDNDLDIVRKLTNATSNLVYGEEAFKGAMGLAKVNDDIVRNLGHVVTAGKMAAAVLEKTTPIGVITNGFVTSFIYDATAARDLGVIEASRQGVIGGVSTYFGNYIIDKTKSGIVAKTLVGGILNALETVAKGGTREESKEAEFVGTGLSFAFGILVK